MAKELNNASSPLSPVGAKLFGADASGNAGFFDRHEAASASTQRYADLESLGGRVVTREHMQCPFESLGAETIGDPKLDGTYTGGLNTMFAGSLGTPICTQEAGSRSGAKAQGVKWNTNAAETESIYVYQNARTPGEWVRMSLWAKRVTGDSGDISPFFYCASGTAGAINQRGGDAIEDVAYKKHVFVGRIPGTKLEFGVRTNATYAALPAGIGSDKVVVDDVSVRVVPFSSLIDIANYSKSVGKWFSKVTLAKYAYGGLVIFANDANPENYVILYHDGTNLVFKKVIAGVWADAASEATKANFLVSVNSAVTYVDGAEISVIREYGTNNFSVYYNGVWISTEEIADSELITNTFHGSFSTHEDSQVVFSYCPADVALNVVYLGGSITNGGSATAQWFGWQWLVRAALDLRYRFVSLIHHNAALGGTDSTVTLSRLVDDVLSKKPAVVFVDQAVNDADLATDMEGWPYVGEAIIRRIRTAYPRSKCVVLDFMRPIGSDGTPSANTEAIRTAWSAIAARYKCEHYSMKDALLGLLGNDATIAEIDAYFASAGNVHPNNAGHALIATSVSQFDILKSDSFTNISDYDWISSGASKYAKAPKVVPASALLDSTDSSGTWTNNGDGSVTSSTVGSELAFTGKFSVVGLDVDLQASAWPTGLQYSLDGAAYVNITPTNTNVPKCEFLELPGYDAHTIKIKLASGSASINALFAI